LKDSEILRKARQARITNHRLRPSLKLRTLDEIQKFVRARSIVSVFGGNELPSVISAIMGQEWKPTKKGFTGWGDWWSIKISGKSPGHALGELDRAKDILSTRIFRGSKTLISHNLWPVLDPIVKHYHTLLIKGKILSDLERKIVELLQSEGPTRTDHIRTRLKLEGKMFTSRFHRALTQLESYALIVGYEDPKPERHLHANIWQLWNTRVAEEINRKPDLAYDKSVKELVASTVDAAILAPEAQVGEWFQWSKEAIAARDELLTSGRILRVGSFLVTKHST
jgi:hypothetical protein